MWMKQGFVACLMWALATGAAAQSAAAGRWLVYSQATGSAGLEPAGTVTGGLSGKSWYGSP